MKTKNYILRDKKTKRLARFEVDTETYLGTGYDGESHHAESETNYAIVLGDNGAIWSTNDIAMAFTVLEGLTTGSDEYCPKNKIKETLEVFCIEENSIVKNDYCVFKVPKNAYHIGIDSIEKVSPKVLFGEEAYIRNAYYIPLTEDNDMRKIKRMYKKDAPFILVGRKVTLHSIVETDFPINEKFKTNRYALVSYEGL